MVEVGGWMGGGARLRMYAPFLKLLLRSSLMNLMGIGYFRPALYLIQFTLSMVRHTEGQRSTNKQGKEGAGTETEGFPLRLRSREKVGLGRGSVGVG